MKLVFKVKMKIYKIGKLRFFSNKICWKENTIKCILTINIIIFCSCNYVDIEIFKRAEQLHSQNIVNRENLDNLYVYFDKSKSIDKDYQKNWNLACSLKTASSKIIYEIDSLKKLIPFFKVKKSTIIKCVYDYQIAIDTLINSTSNSKKISLNCNFLSKSNWGFKENLAMLDLTLLENSVINQETVLLICLFNDLYNEIGYKIEFEMFHLKQKLDSLNSI